MNVVTVVHLREPYRQGALRELVGPPDAAAIVEAPVEAAAEFKSEGAWVGAEAVTPVFREAYYRTLEAFLRPEASTWGRGLSPAVLQVVEPAALDVAGHTWTEAELLLHLGRRAEGERIDALRIVTDNAAGYLYWRLLQAVRESLGARDVKLQTVANRDPLPTVWRRWDPKVRSKAWRRHLLALQDGAFGSLRPRTDRAVSATSEPSVVLFTDSPRTWRHLRPIYLQLVEDGVTTIVLTSRSPMASRLRHEHIRVTFASPRLLPLNFRRDLRDALERLPLAPNGLAIPGEPIERALRTMLLLRLSEAARRTLSLREAVQELSTLLSRACFVHAAYSEAGGRAVTLEAHALGRATALVPHGLIDGARPELQYFPAADAFLAWGDEMREGLLRSGLLPTTSVLVLGWPFLEETLDRAAVVDPIRSNAEGNARPIVLVVFGRPSRVIRRAVYEAAATEVLETAARRRDLDFVVKVHPADTSGFWPAVAARSRRPNLRIVETGDLYELLHNSWVVVTRHSTAGAEAICAGKPLVVVDIAQDGAPAGTDADYVAFGAAYRVDVPGELLKVLSSLEAVEPGEDELAFKRSAYAARFLSRTEEPAAKRASGFLTELATTTKGGDVEGGGHVAGTSQVASQEGRSTG